MGFLPTAFADHITGGEMYYTLLSVNGGVYHYRVNVRLFMDCYSGRQLPNPAIFGVFDKATATRIEDIEVPMSNQTNLTLTNAGPCVTNPPRVCYEIGNYSFDITVPAAVQGYVVVLQVVYRVNGIANLMQGYGNVGATYTADIPGTSQVANGPTNSSAHFNGSDLVVICADNSFTYNFGAEDPDGDQLRYSFCEAFTGGASGGLGTNTSPVPPPYYPVPYNSNFAGNSPLGGAVRIDPNTGVVTGIAPSEGKYVVTVCVDEIRNGKVIATQRKDLQISITDCNIAAASIPPEFMLCKTSQTINLSNNSNSPLIKTYSWEVLNASGTSIFSSANPTATYTFADTGVYMVKLVINRHEQCSDSATSTAYVYPGFRPDFNFRGICFTKPTQFFDATTSVFGTVNSWKWDLGETFAADDVSDIRNPVYTYISMGVKNVRLITTNTKGCRDTATKSIVIMDKPPLTVRFRDTLICVPDVVQLEAIGSGLFSWTPGTSITNANTSTPTVNPVTTTTYVVRLDDNGCLNSDSVRVRVVDYVTLTAMNDTTICQGDTIRLHISSDGLQYLWTPTPEVLFPAVANPWVVTNTLTSYTVTARIGSCTSTDRVVVTPIPYPVAYAGPDTVICHEMTAHLHASTDGNSYAWMPSRTLSNPNILDPIANPTTTTDYVFYGNDTRGCPKPGYDTVRVTVLPDIIPSAGRDTAVVVGQPLRMNATGGVRYLWSPPGGLSDPAIANPVITYQESTSGILYKVLVYNEAGCADSAYIRVKVFETMPSVFVPNAFTPNNDGFNDVLRPKAAGMQKIEYFQIFNRWGQLVFSTHVNEHGWDGTIGGKQQQIGTYVWVVKAVDYTGAQYTQRGIVMLIR